jgi:hypothetical protein
MQHRSRAVNRYHNGKAASKPDHLKMQTMKQGDN